MYVPVSSVTVELPEELIELIGTTDLTSERIREALVLDLLRAAAVSQGQAARLLGISRWDLLDSQTWVCGAVARAESLQQITSQGARRHAVPTDLPVSIALSERLRDRFAGDWWRGRGRRGRGRRQTGWR